MAAAVKLAELPSQQIHDIPCRSELEYQLVTASLCLGLRAARRRHALPVVGPGHLDCHCTPGSDSSPTVYNVYIKFFESFEV